MPYKKRKQKCKQSDGTPGSYVLSYTTKKGEKRSACHTSQKKMQGQIAAIEAEADESEEEVLAEVRAYVRMLLEKVYYDADGNPIAVNSEIEAMIQAYQKEKAAETEKQRASSARIDRGALKGAMFARKSDAEGIPSSDWVSALRLGYKTKALPKDVRDLIGNETFQETLADFIGVPVAEIQGLATRDWKSRSEGKKPDDAAALAAMSSGVKEWLAGAANEALAGERVSQRREELRQLRNSLKNDGISDSAVKQVIDLTEEMVRTGIGDNFMGQTIRALSKLSEDEVSQLRGQSLSVGDGSIPKTEGFEALFDIAEGSRNENLGRGEILAYYYFDNVNPPDFASGEHDLVVSGVDTHVKNLTGGKDKAEYEGIPNQSKKKIMESPEFSADLDADILANFVKVFKGGKNIAGANVRDWAVKFANDQATAGKKTPQEASDEMKAFLEQLFENLQTAARVYAVGTEAQCLYFIGDTLTYKMRPASEMYFYSTDAAATNVTMRADKALNMERASIQTAFEKLDKLAETTVAESIIRGLVKESLLTEELNGSDKSEIKRMIKKELEGPSNRREIDKAFKKKFDAELKKALGSSFFGTPGKINKFVADEIQKEVEKHLGSAANREVVVRICKDVMVKLYRELSFSYKPLIDRMKV